MLIRFQINNSGIMFEDTLDITAVDAAHHRLVNQRDSNENFPFECYSCCEVFSSLQNLVNHINVNNYHSQESCLKCKTYITVFYHKSDVIHLHTCLKSSLRHLNSDLFIQSKYLGSKLNLTENISSSMSDIACDIQACPETFTPTVNGIYEYLKHVNNYFHSTISNCRKCTLPEFRMVVNNLETVSHFCTEIGKPKCIMKS